MGTTILLSVSVILTTVNTLYNFVVTQLLSHVWLFVTPQTIACQAPLSSTIPRSLLKFMFIESVMLSNLLVLCCPLLILPSIFPSIKIFPVYKWNHSICLFAMGLFHLVQCLKFHPWCSMLHPVLPSSFMWLWGPCIKGTVYFCIPGNPVKRMLEKWRWTYIFRALVCVNWALSFHPCQVKNSLSWLGPGRVWVAGGAQLPKLSIKLCSKPTCRHVREPSQGHPSPQWPTDTQDIIRHDCYYWVLGWFLICVHACLVVESSLTLWNPMGCSPPSSSLRGDSPGKDPGVGYHALLLGIFPTQGLSQHL